MTKGLIILVISLALILGCFCNPMRRSMAKMVDSSIVSNSKQAIITEDGRKMYPADWSLCGPPQKENQIIITGVFVDCLHAVPGKNLTVRAEAVIVSELIDTASIHSELRSNMVSSIVDHPIAPFDYNMCTDGDDVCPLIPGPIGVSLSKKVPKMTMAGDYQLRAYITLNGKLAMCVNVDIIVDRTPCSH